VEESVEYFHLAVFKGTYRHRIDGKGRLPVPAPFRRVLSTQGADRIVVTVLDQCLAAYAPLDWARLETQIASLPAFNRQVKAVTRLLASRAADCDLDAQGRILLPPALRQAATLGREAVVIGALSRFEIWAPEAWEGFLRESERLLDDVALDLPWPLAPPPASSPPGPPSGAALPQAKPSR
jgi:MraZ protein